MSGGRRASNLTGQRFGRLVAGEYAPSNTYRAYPGYWCGCDCGNRCFASTGNLTSGKQVSCGCRHHESGVTACRFKHGGSHGQLWAVWNGIRTRCGNPNSKSYPRYGGRGVRICNRWAADFAAFRNDLGERPSDGMTLDRTDNDGHYSCGKCEECRDHGWPTNLRWATHLEQNRNRSCTVRLTYRGEEASLGEWAERVGIPRKVLWARINVLGWGDAERILTTPHRKRRAGRTAPISSLRTGILTRCYNPKYVGYPGYGGRGITVCQRWRGSLAAFKADVGDRPGPGYSLDRIDNNGGYWCGKPECPECGPLGREPNWRWATAKEQTANRRPKFTCTRPS